MRKDGDLDARQVMADLSSRGFSYVAAIPEGFDHLSWLRRLGPPMPQYGGELVRDVRPDTDADTGAYSTAALPPHTEWYEFSDLPPRYVALWCVAEGEGPGGETTLADGYSFLDGLTPEERHRLLTEDQNWRSARTLLAREGVDQHSRHRILSHHSGTLVMRFSTLDLQAENGSDLARHYVTAGLTFFQANHVAIKIQRNAMLVWDNWRMMHSRNGFTDRRRHLRRVLIRARDA